MAIKEHIKVATAKIQGLIPADQVEVLRSRFNALSAQEQLVLKAGAVFLGVSLVILVVWFPAHQFAQSRYESFAENKDLLVWMHANEAAARRSATLSGGEARSAQALMGVINMALRTRTLTAKRLEPEGEKSVRVWLENVPYEQLMLWLFDLENQYQVHIKQITIDKQEAAGYVNAHILFGS